MGHPAKAVSAVWLAFSCTVLSCDREPDAAATQQTAKIYRAELQAVNAALTGPVAGTATVVVDADMVVLQSQAEGVPADMMHLQHLHGHARGWTAECPQADDDGNGDGVIDVMEAIRTAGMPMIPFHRYPTVMEMAADTYPLAQGNQLIYKQAVDADDLTAAFVEAFPNQDFEWDERTFIIHGVPAEANVPETARSFPGAPAHMTLPIACGTFERS